MVDDVALNKTAIIERCLSRVREEYRGSESSLESDLTRQDSIILNLERACNASIDLAMHLVRRRRLGLPQDSRAAFTLLEEAGILPAETARKMCAMVGFRNVAMHQYQKINLEILRSILEERLGDFTEFTQYALGA